MKKQVLIIRGAESFEKYEDYLDYLRTVHLDPYEQRKNWRDWIIWALSGSHGVLVPQMPSKDNAKYDAWKIWFERYLEFITDPNPIVVGHSCGVSFLLKYLSENSFPKRIKQLHLVAGWVTDEPPLPDSTERLSTFQFDIKNLYKVKEFCDEVHVWYSEDDNVVPFTNSKIILEQIPFSIPHRFVDRGHFLQPAFIELLQSIQGVE